jgi:hypothetical protein
MPENKNPILNDEAMFEWLLLKAVKLIDLSEKETKHCFATEQGLELYSKLSQETLAAIPESRRGNVGFMVSVLQIMGVLSILDDKMVANRDDIEGSNVIDFVKHKREREKSQSYLKHRKVL